LKNIFKFYQLNNINVGKFEKCVDSIENLFGILI